jgi:methylmalonyl-CoA/ethylmalonyl-CoA epimerase
MTKIKKIHHVAIVVDNIEDSLNFWEALGLEIESIKEVPEHDSKVAFLPVGDSEIELVESTDDSSGIARYLAKRGPGLHHICIEVEGIDSILIDLLEKGIRLINTEPLSGEGGRRYAFIHPESTKGVLIELYELPG